MGRASERRKKPKGGCYSADLTAEVSSRLSKVQALELFSLGALRHDRENCWFHQI